jgi:hypothetical protein
MDTIELDLPFDHGFVDMVRTKFKEGAIVWPRMGAAGVDSTKSACYGDTICQPSAVKP